MKVLIHDYKEKKDISSLYLELSTVLDNAKIEYEIISEKDFDKNYSADAIISLGGDGTILFLTEFAIKNNLPILGINAGKLGFLTEFEKDDIKNAIDLLKTGKLIVEERSVINLEIKGKKFICQNDVFLRKIYSDQASNKMAEVMVKVDGKTASSFKGDGVIIATPTGSTAYSLSAGGPILVPIIDAFIITPIAAHSLVQRPIVFSAKSVSEISLVGDGEANVYEDGRLIGSITSNDKIIITKNDNPIKFYRQENYDFFAKLTQKLKNNASE